VHNVSDVRQIEIHKAEPLVPGPSRLDVEIAIAKLEKYKSPGSNEIVAKRIEAGGEILLSMIHKLINSIWNKEELSDPYVSVVLTIIKHFYKQHNVSMLDTKVLEVTHPLLLPLPCKNASQAYRCVYILYKKLFL
jgi:hypothetical protein